MSLLCCWVNHIASFMFDCIIFFIFLYCFKKYLPKKSKKTLFVLQNKIWTYISKL